MIGWDLTKTNLKVNNVCEIFVNVNWCVLYLETIRFNTRIQAGYSLESIHIIFAFNIFLYRKTTQIASRWVYTRNSHKRSSRLGSSHVYQNAARWGTLPIQVNQLLSMLRRRHTFWTSVLMAWHSIKCECLSDGLLIFELFSWFIAEMFDFTLDWFWNFGVNKVPNQMREEEKAFAASKQRQGQEICWPCFDYCCWFWYLRKWQNCRWRNSRPLAGIAQIGLST